MDHILTDYKRTIVKQLPPKISAFLFGPRQTGKSTTIRSLNPTREIDLLNHTTFFKYNRDPDRLFNELKSLKEKSGALIWIDEVQKIPGLLDVAHRSMEAFPEIKFIMTGSSARKLRRGASNLLGGRALDLRLHPLSIEEIGASFHLDMALRYGTLPKYYSLLEASEEALVQDLLSSYVSTYLEDEIRSEAIVKALDSFQRFLEVSAAQHSKQVNFSKIADDCLVSSNTVQNYYSVLEDTLIGAFLPAYSESVRKQMSQRPKFYFFDNGVTRAIQGLVRSEVSNIEKGDLFEQFVFQELTKLNDYYKKDFRFYLWRTAHGAEVDFLILRGKKILMAVECKGTSNPSKRDLEGLRSFKRTCPNVDTVLCAIIDEDFVIDNGFEAVSIFSLLERVKVL